MIRDRSFSIAITPTAATAAGAFYKTICLGDSLTYGYGGEDVLGPFVPYPTQLGDWMNWRQYDNEGVSGQTSAQIMARFVAHPEWTANTIVLWTGRNDIGLSASWSTLYTIPAIDDFVAAMALANNPNYIILGVTNSGSEYIGAGGAAEDHYNQIIAHNAACAVRYGDKFLDIRSWMASVAPFDVLGLTPSSQDYDDIAVDKIPTTLRRDATNVHFNNYGTDANAYLISTRLAQLPAPDGLNQQGAVTMGSLFDLYGQGALNGQDYVRAYKGFALGDPGTGSGIVIQDNPRKSILMIGGGQAIPDNISGTATTSEWVFVGRNAGGTLSTGRGNTGMGADTLKSLTTGGFNTAMGTNALELATETSSNVAIGYDSLASLTNQSTGNVAVGRYALMNTVSTNPNTAVGFQALYSNTTGSYNTALGYSALRNATTASNNVAVGRNALTATVDGGSNTAVGMGALSTNVSGTGNVAVGANALLLATGSDNTALGRSTGSAMTTGIRNVFAGSVAGAAATTMQNSVALGYSALNAGTTAHSTVAIGSGALAAVTTATANTAVGTSALSLATGGNNIALGYQAGDDITTGTRNMVIGHNIDSPNGAGSDQMTIGNMIYGVGMDGSGTTPSTGNIGIGGSPGGSGAPKLDVYGDMIRLRTSKTPSSASDSGNAGTICWDASYVYVCIASGTWKRAAISTW